jgi:hypothetical protein
MLCEIYWVHEVRITIISSGFEGAKIAVFETPDYALEAVYITQSAYNRIKEEGKRDL